MKTLAMAIALAFVLVPLEADIAELSMEGSSMESRYCEITYSGGVLTYDDTDGSTATIVIQFRGTESTEVTLSDGKVLPMSSFKYRKGTCTAIYENVSPGRYTLSGVNGPTLISASPDNGPYSGNWSA